MQKLITLLVIAGCLLFLSPLKHTFPKKLYAKNGSGEQLKMKQFEVSLSFFWPMM